MYRRSRFSRFAKWIARETGNPAVFGLALLTIVVWIATGPMFGLSDTWQLVINTGTTIVTFLMVFLIQNTQNLEGAHNVLLDMEELEEKELDHIRQRYIKLARQAREKRRTGRATSTRRRSFPTSRARALPGKPGRYSAFNERSSHFSS